MVAERTAAPAPDAGLAAREAALQAKEAQLQAAFATVSTAFAILGSRALLMVAVLASCAAWGFALWRDSGYGLLGAALVTAMIFWPALWMDRTRG